MRTLVAQIGARRHYAVPRALHEAGSLELLVTDACAETLPWRWAAHLPARWQPKSLQAVVNRRLGSVEPKFIQSLPSFLLARQFGSLRRGPNESLSSFWVRQNRWFCEKICHQDWGRADTVYAFNGAALEIFQLAKKRGLRCVLDQTAAPWRYNTALLRDEQQRWPGWEENPADIDSEGDMIGREEAEWGLADRIICGSKFVVDTLGLGGPAAKCRVVPYPKPAHLAKFPMETSLRRQGGPLRLLFVGTLQLRKGIQYLSEAAASLDARRFTIRVVGPNHLSLEGDRIVRSRLQLVGQVPRSDVSSHYEWADAFVLPTLSEGSANVCHEALSAGLPVVTTSAAGVFSSSPQLRVVEARTAHSLINEFERLAGRMDENESSPEPEDDAIYPDCLVHAMLDNGN